MWHENQRKKTGGKEGGKPYLVIILLGSQFLTFLTLTENNKSL